ncbi:MAG: amidohydrolase family protein, partial [Chitinophagaceae bacterium]|nr:amidohydrolase family protein [Chitinophagaceae bacterium]
MRIFLFLSLFLVALISNAQQQAFVHVNVVNVVTGKIDVDQTVLLDSNRIIAVGQFKKIKVPATATLIDASNQFLMPGMIDAHIHFFQSGGLYTRPDGLNLGAVYPYEKDQRWIKDNQASLMKRYLAAGITTVVDVGGPLSNYKVRSTLDTTALAPNAWVTGPLISTYLPPNLDKTDPPIIKVTSPDEARELVKRQLPYKPDFIKIWYIVFPGQSAASTLPIIKAAIDESHANGLKVAVHATEFETAKLAVQNGADILVHSVDDTLMNTEMLDLLKSKQTVYIPTLAVAQNYDRTFTQQFNFSPYELRYADPFMIGTLLDIQHIEKAKLPFDYKKIRTRLSIPGKSDTIMLSNLLALQKKGGLVVAGTDAGNIGTQHASSFYPELLLMQKAGLSNWEILRSAT